MNYHLRRWIWLAPVLLLLLAGFWRLRFDVEVLSLLPDDIPEVTGLKLYQQHFSNSRELIITVRAPDPEAAATAARMLAEQLRAATNQVASALWQPPWLEHQEEMGRLIAYLWLNQPPGEFAALVDRLRPEKRAEVLQDAKDQLATSFSPMDIARAGYDPYRLTQLPGDAGGPVSLHSQEEGFSSDDGCFRVVYVEPKNLPSNYQACSEWLAQIKQTVSPFQQAASWPENVTLRYTAGPAFMAEIGQSMEVDLKQSVLGALILIAALFGWAHRRWLPLGWLVTLLLLIGACTLALGGLVFGTLNVISFGFAAILLGFAVDYGLVLYQEAVARPRASSAMLRRQLAPSILWSSMTTAAAFVLLNFSGLPGLAQLGSLVAMGILLSAGVILFAFLPVALKGRIPSVESTVADEKRENLQVEPKMVFSTRPLWMTGLLMAMAGGILFVKPPEVDHSTKPLQPANLPAQDALDEMQRELGFSGEPGWVIISGKDERVVAERLQRVKTILTQAVTDQLIRHFLLPSSLWPHPDWQQDNRPQALALAHQAEAWRADLIQAGFATNALFLTESVLAEWVRLGASTEIARPPGHTGRWLMKRAAAQSGSEWLVMGVFHPGQQPDRAFDARLWKEAGSGVLVTSWTRLGEVLLHHMEKRATWLTVVMAGLVLVCLRLAFRRWQEVGLSVAALSLSLLLLLAVMGIAGWSWNLLNFMAIPLLLGAGVDYSIHMQTALRRCGGHGNMVKHTIGRALVLCAATTAIGFGSLAGSNNAGMASLGRVCATGVACSWLVAGLLLPSWWMALCRDAPERPAVPSRFYRAMLWRLGLWLVGWLPGPMIHGISGLFAEFYYRFHRQRRNVVERNLLPVFEGDSDAARQAARRLFHQFGWKLADLWRYESGVPVQRWFNDLSGWERIRAAQARQKGVLLITPHLGNWEIGGALLASQGIPLMVITLNEPDPQLTELRRARRAHWGIQTLVIGQDAFAFVEVIKRLQEGAVVALLIDRPPSPAGVEVQLFGRPFQASIAAAELARATGCALLGVCLLRVPGGYSAEVLPEFEYDRRQLADREARRLLTGQILRAFEPHIRQNPDQWFHFVPIWPEGGEPHERGPSSS